MKTIKFYMGISFLAALLLFSGCGKGLDELSTGGSDTESPENPEQAEGELLRLRVSDAGYLDAGTGSRATDSGLSTTFEDGDKIGLFVVNNENEVLYANVPYTKNGEEWTPTQNVRTKGYPVRVFAYYPYVEDDKIIGKINKEAQDASAFFQTYIEGLDISNQSTLADYRQADVMACMVKIEDKDAARKELTLTMNHLMGLLVIDFPEEVTLTKVKHYLKGDKSYSWLVEEEKSFPFESENESLSIQAFREENGYRYICRNNEAVSFSGSFTTYGSGKNYSVSDATVSSGSCKTYRISVKPFEPVFPVSEEYTPQVGDFYMKDGAILSSISEDNKADCIGIVFWLGNPTVSDPVLRAAYPKCIHGLVISLKEETRNILWQVKSESSTIQSWAEDETFYINGIYNALDYNIGLNDSNPGEIQGYNNTEILKRYDSSHSSYPVTVLSCFSTISSGVTLPTDKTSGWYLPSPKELVELCNAIIKVNKSLSTLNKVEISKSGYWSSGEYGAGSAYVVGMYDGGYLYFYSKSVVHSVRLVFAF